MVGLGVACLAGCSPTTYPRHRWTGFTECVSWPLLLESIHGLLSQTYKLWAAKVRGGEEFHDELQRFHDMAKAGEDHAANEFAGMIAGVEGEDGLQGHHFDPAAHGDQASGVHGDKRLEQSHFRHVSLTWLCGGQALGQMYLLRLILGPVSACMDRYLRVAGEKWEYRQLEKAAAASRNPNEEGRTFRASLVESGHFEGPALQEIRDLMLSQRAWEHVPARFRTASLRTTATLALSRAGTGMQKLRDKHCNYPIKLFSVWRSEEEADSIEKDPRCRFDDFSWGVVEPYRYPGGMKHPDLRMKLEAMAHLMEFEMASVESFQAHLRRMTHSFSCQTHTEDVSDASAEWILRRIRTQMSDRNTVAGTSETSSSAKPTGNGKAGCRQFAWAKVRQ